MAHELADNNGRPAIAYFGETPWHRLGTKLDSPATAAQAIDATGLDYLAEPTLIRMKANTMDLKSSMSLVKIRCSSRGLPLLP